MMSQKLLACTLVVAACAGTVNGFVAPTGRMPTKFFSRLSMASKESVLIIGGTRCELDLFVCVPSLPVKMYMFCSRIRCCMPLNFFFPSI